MIIYNCPKCKDVNNLIVTKDYEKHIIKIQQEGLPVTDCSFVIFECSFCNISLSINKDYYILFNKTNGEIVKATTYDCELAEYL